jgi:hypothetical protein
MGLPGRWGSLQNCGTQLGARSGVAGKCPAVAGWKPNRDRRAAATPGAAACWNRALLDLITMSNSSIATQAARAPQGDATSSRSQENTGGQGRPQISSLTWGPPRGHHRGMRAPDLIREGQWGHSSREQRSWDAACVAGIRLGHGLPVTIPKSRNGRLYHRLATRQSLSWAQVRPCSRIRVHAGRSVAMAGNTLPVHSAPRCDL